MDSESDVFQLQCQLMSSRLPRLVIIPVEGDVDTTPPGLGKLRQLGRAQMGANGRSGIAKAGLPQYGRSNKPSTRMTAEK